ncbi:MAG: translocation/assembly module TamB domain-containing protein [Candidatus Contendobacter sp.]|nr:translocation/assembly module TamB domain-containing protein [Gammaproteobacteria bacterium]MCC8993142.1 translocation/assembly module TamB domain-containing protein [Candidatus Contendobacter sp.]
MSTSQGVRRLLLRLLLWLPLLLLTVLLLTAGLAVSTEPGLKMLLALAERALPGQLSYGQAGGSLLGPLWIKQLRYQDGVLIVALADGEFDWQPADLLDATLTISRLHLEGLELQLPPGDPAAPTAEPLTLPQIELPLAIQLANVEIRSISIQPPDAEPILLDAVNLKAHTEAGALTIDPLEIWAAQGELHLSGRLNPTGGYPLSAQVIWQFLTPDYGVVIGQGTIQGELQDQLQVTQRITGPATLELTGEIRQPLAAKPAWSAKTKLDIADLKPLIPELTGQALTAKIEAQGILAQFQGQGELTAGLPELGLTTVRFNATGDENSLNLEQLKLTAAHQPLALNLKGDLQFDELKFNAAGQWQSLVWPLAGPPQIASSQGDFTIQGGIKDYRFQLAAELQGAEIPKGRWTLTGQGSDQAVRDVKLNGQTLDGVIQGHTEVAWLPALRWQAALAGEGLNPGVQWKEVPGKLNLRLKSDGSFEQKLRANLLLENLSGTLNGQTVSGNADLAVQDQGLTIKTLRINAGDAKIEADGALNQRWQLRWKVDAPKLQGLIPGLSGNIASTGQLTGPRDHPEIAADFNVQNLGYGDTRIQQIRGTVNLDTGGANRSKLQLNGQGLTLGGQQWKTLNLDGSGTPAAHELKAEIIGEPGQFNLALTGNLQLPALTWQGRIAQLSMKNISMKNTVAGAWTLDKPAALRASAKEANLDSACLSSPPTRLCFQGQWQQGRGFNARTQLSNLSPERFKAFLPPGIVIATSVSGEATINGKDVNNLQGTLNLTLAPGSLKMDANGQLLRFTLNGGNLQGDLNGRNLNAQAKLDLAQTGQMQANVQIQDPLGTPRLNGKLNAALTDLSVISLFAPQLQNVSGQVRANVAATGVLPKLALRGEVRLENAGAAIPEAGIKLQNLQLAAIGDGQGPLQLMGSVRSGSGQLQLTGEVNPLKPQLSLNIKGQGFQALNTADLQVQISPDLQLNATQQQVKLDGEVTIPRAFLRPGGNRPGVIRPSGDVVIVNGANGEKPPPQRPGLELYARVQVILGDDVRVETSAFQGRLKGRLLVEETPQLAPRGSGAIEVVAGNYRIYGEDIQIQRGQLLFSSSPLDNPGLDLRVVRQSENSATGQSITAGAQISGTLRNPRLTLFSDPKMPNSSILSYLVFGRGAQGGSGGESALLYKAASAMGFGAGTLTKSLGDAFGLDALELNAGDGSKATSLMLGKYLAPNLYVGYGVGLFNAVNTFNVKYRISKRLLFESNSSASGVGADLIYTVEH